MTFEKPEFTTREGEVAHGKRPSMKEIREKLEKAIRDDSELSARLSRRENIFFPGPRSASSEDAEAYRDSFDKIEKEKDNIIKFPKKPELEEPKTEKAA